MADDTYRSQFRLPYPLYERVKEQADKNRRSLNAEIVARLQESLDEPQPREISLDEETRRELLSQLMSEYMEAGLERMLEKKRDEGKKE